MTSFEKLIRALERMISKDDDMAPAISILQSTERNIVSHLRSALELEFPNFQVDTEYNRRGEDKKLRPNGKLFRPDILVHRRGDTRQSNNLIHIEMKCQKNWKGKMPSVLVADDWIKLRENSYKDQFSIVIDPQKKIVWISKNLQEGYKTMSDWIQMAGAVGIEPTTLGFVPTAGDQMSSASLALGSNSI